MLTTMLVMIGKEKNQPFHRILLSPSGRPRLSMSHAAPTTTSATPKIRIHLPIMLISGLYRTIILICDQKHRLGYSKTVRPAYDYGGKSLLREARS